MRRDPLRIPIEVTLGAIDNVARLFQAVILAGINNELGGHALAAQSFIHLLGVEQRHVEIRFAAKKERGRFDFVGVEKRIGDARPGLGIFPRHAKLVLVIEDVLVGAVAGEDIRDRCAARSRFETRRRRDEIIRGNAAVTPTADAEPIRIGQAARHGVIDRGQIVLDIAVPPIGVNPHREFLAAAGRAARIRQDDGVTIRREQLRFEIEFARVLRLRSAMRPEQRRRFRSRGDIERSNNEAVDLGAVRAFKLRFLRTRDPQVFHEGFGLFREVAELFFFNRENFVRPIWRARPDDDLAVAADIIRGHFSAAVRDRLRRAAVDRDAHEILHAVIFHHRKKRLPVRRPMRLDNIAIEFLRQNFRLAAGGRNDRQRMDRVLDLLRVAAVNVSDPFPVGAPGRRAVPVRMRIGFRRSGELPFLRAGLRADHPDVPVLGAIRIVSALGDERDFFSVRRPRRPNVIVFAGSERLGLARREIEQLQMRITLGQVTVDVLLEIKAIDHQRRNCLLFLLLFLRLTRIGIVDDERDPFRIRRPGEIVHAAFRVGQFFRFAAANRQHPELIVLVVVLATGKEPDPFSIGTPARMFLALVAEGERAVLRAVPLREPEIRRALVLLHVCDLDDVGDQVAVRRNVWFIHLAQLREIFRLQNASWIGSESCRNTERGNEDEEPHAASAVAGRRNNRDGCGRRRWNACRPRLIQVRTAPCRDKENCRALVAGSFAP